MDRADRTEHKRPVAIALVFWLDSSMLVELYHWSSRVPGLTFFVDP